MKPVLKPFADQGVTWPEAILYLGGLIAVLLVMGVAVSAFIELRKIKLTTQQADDLRQLVSRYEQLAASALDVQQRTAADVAELRTQTASIEKILRTVE
ncbi:hypothetical protein J5X84_31455 [Streptosporangiaceae bacterium NEAU-GS5]|nr:hypothetical protein [Streptosporangiaceae bacterium NEAU-GS5]